MKLILKVVVSIIWIIASTLNAQDFQGQATYKTKRKIDIKLDSTQMNTEMHQRMMEMVKKQFEKTFILNFNKQESSYKEDIPLEGPRVGMGMEMVMINTSIWQQQNLY